MPTPSLPARFQPQQWIGDFAVDSAPLETFDAALAVLSLTADRLRYLVDQSSLLSGRDLDDVAVAAGVLGDHGGPFYVDIDAAALKEFLAEVGIMDVSQATDDQVATAKADYEALAAAPTP